ncbi:hypothetical protein [Algoriella sp.]|uniref:hypothetical protein n=1 Tax=Algoriella sp. TaxID=1872434 RepID=UPI001B0FAC4A|nr:hypothetical protein [Algoriella sp.]MBO6211774.1 hypothetical protein [Algoriella sp.]
MKNLFYSIIALCSLTAFGQEKNYSFDKKVSYKISLPEEYSTYFEGQKDLLFVTYLSKDAILGTSEGGPYVNGSFNKDAFFINNSKFFEVYANSLENQLSIKAPYYYEGVSDENLKPYSDNLFEKFLSIKNLNSSTTINGYKCNEYELTSTIEGENASTLCIDEKNAINNVGIIFPQTKLKGLLVRYDAGDFNGLTIQSIANSNVKVSFDEKKEIEDFTNEIAKKKQEYDNLMSNVDSTTSAVEAYSPDNRYEDPIINYYTYQSSESNNVNNLFATIASLNYNLVYTDNDFDGNPDIERSTALTTAQGSTNQLIKQFKKNKLANKSEVKELNELFKKYYDDAKAFKLVDDPNYDATDAAAAAVDSAYAATEVSLADYYDPYESTYKTDDISVIDLAINNPDVKEYLKIAPKHCTDLKTKIPTFSDKDLGNLVYNYAGQACDLYIYNSGSVSLTETVNALRKSVLEINNKTDKLTKDDKEKLITFLNSLD